MRYYDSDFCLYFCLFWKKKKMSLGGADAVMVRQKLQILDQFCICDKQNLYHVAPLSREVAMMESPKDEEFREMNEVWFMQERSSFCCRICCGDFREFEMDVNHSSGSKILQFTRPFRCTLCFPCCCLCPQEIMVADGGGNRIGSVVCEFRWFRMCCCGEIWFAVREGSDDSNHEVIGYVKHISPICCNGCQNCCAPTCCNESWNDPITDADGKERTGLLKNIFPGVGLRCFTDADNYLLAFPSDSTPNQKGLYLGALTLIEYFFFGRQQNNQ
jgi:hypothetical protein